MPAVGNKIKRLGLPGLIEQTPGHLGGDYFVFAINDADGDSSLWAYPPPQVEDLRPPPPEHPGFYTGVQKIELTPWIAPEGIKTSSDPTSDQGAATRTDQDYAPTSDPEDEPVNELETPADRSPL